MQIEWMTAGELRQAYIARTLSPVEVARALLERIERLDRKLHAFITVNPDAVMAQARRAETMLSKEAFLGPLHGVPVSIKDTIDATGLRATSGSALRAHRVPTRDAIAVARLRAAGAIILGKTNTSEFATSGRTVNRLGPETVNSWDERRTAAGSSGGAGAAVAAGLGPIAIGTDAGGSIRFPAAFNGVFGLMPSHDTVPKLGNFEITEFGSPFSSIGPLARDVRSAAVALQTMAGHDPADPASSRRPVPDYLAACALDIEGLKIGWLAPPANAHREIGVEEAIRAACDGFVSLGATVRSIDATLPDALTISGTILLAVAAELRLVAADPSLRSMLTPYAAELFSYPAPSPERVADAWKARQRAVDMMSDLFKNVDVIASPVTCFTAPVRPADPFSIFVSYERYIAVPAIANVAGLAAASIPCGFYQGMPLGLMLMAPPGAEPRLLATAAAFERAWPWAGQRPTFA